MDRGPRAAAVKEVARHRPRGGEHFLHEKGGRRRVADWRLKQTLDYAARRLLQPHSR